MKKTALITGISGQDGAYLAEFLLNKNYKIIGTDRRSARSVNWRLRRLNIENQIIFEEMELGEIYEIQRVFKKYKLNEVYNLAAQSHVAVSFSNPIFTTQVGTLGSISLLEAIRNADKNTKFYQASSSEMYGGASKEMLNENSKFDPKSPYAASKVFAHEITKIYRDSYGIFGVNGILFNHESPLRGETFVTRKISRAVGRISVGLQEKLTLGNLDASRDWGYAKDYVNGMWKMMQHDTPDDWVLATGKTQTVREFAEEAFKYVDLNWEDYVITSEKYFRPNEVDYLLGDSTKARETLGWKPEVDFKELVKIMVEQDIIEAKKDYSLIKEGLILPTWEHPTIN